MFVEVSSTAVRKSKLKNRESVNKKYPTKNKAKMQQHFSEVQRLVTIGEKSDPYVKRSNPQLFIKSNNKLMVHVDTIPDSMDIKSRPPHSDRPKDKTKDSPIIGYRVLRYLKSRSTLP